MATALAVWAASPLAAGGEVAASAAAPFDAVFRDWMKTYRVERGVLGVAHDGKLLLLKGYGGLDPRQPVPLASLSKAITGACVASLVRDGTISLATKLGDVLGAFFAKQGEPTDPRVRAITVEQLLTHRSGFSRSANPDPASGIALVAHLREFGGGKPGIDAAMKRALAYRLVRAPGAAYEYVNVNYLILGKVIEAASGRAYEAYCRDAVLRPAGATGHLGPKWAALSAYGGWSLTAADYLAFLGRFDRASGMTDIATWRWLASPQGKRLGYAPHAHYALGVVVSRDHDGLNFAHTGLWTHAQRDAAGGPLAASHANLAVKSSSGAAWFVYMSPQPPNAARTALDKALWRVHDQIKWPKPAPQVRLPNARAAASRE